MRVDNLDPDGQWRIASALRLASRGKGGRGERGAGALRMVSQFTDAVVKTQAVSIKSCRQNVRKEYLDIQYPLLLHAASRLRTVLYADMAHPPCSLGDVTTSHIKTVCWAVPTFSFVGLLPHP